MGEGLTVVSPKMWPSFRSRFGRNLNRRLILRSLIPIVEAMPEKPVVVTTLPLVADLVGRLPVARWVYYCVDDFSQWPGYDGETMRRMERELVPGVDEVIAVSDTLVSHVANLGKPGRLLTHGVDLDFWRQSIASGIPGEFAGLQPPLVVFWGVVDRRTDLEFVRTLTTRLTRGTVVFVGPREDPDPALFALPHVASHPAVAYDRLPALAAAASVLVMPYVDRPVTRAMQPLKLKEYLATGKPVVLRGLPATRPWADACDVAETADEFAVKIVERIATGLPDGQRMARERLNSEGWAVKAKKFEDWIDHG
jgi:glycosyltransferase involved in cell wall biosynthesis